MTLEEVMAALRQAGEEARERLLRTHQAREEALRISREMIRGAADSIRATHRGETALARQLLEQVSQLARQVHDRLGDHPEVFYAGFVEDALKEYVEAAVTMAFVEGTPLPRMEELKVGPAPYLNGLAEAVGELRRYVLDSLRRDDFGRCEELLAIMDEVYGLLVTVDFPEAVTRGLRRSTDAVRGILERTHGDLTVALRQRRLEAELAALERALKSTGAGGTQGPA